MQVNNNKEVHDIASRSKRLATPVSLKSRMLNTLRALNLKPFKKPSGKTVIFVCTSVLITLFIAAILACITMFIYSDRYSTEARLLDQAVTETTSIAETLKASNGDLAAAGQLLRSHQLYDADENTLTLYYDDSLRPAAQADSPYRAVIEKTAADNCFQYEIRIYGGSENKDIYRLTFRAVKTGGGE